MQLNPGGTRSARGGCGAGPPGPGHGPVPLLGWRLRTAHVVVTILLWGVRGAGEDRVPLLEGGVAVLTTDRLSWRRRMTLSPLAQSNTNVPQRKVSATVQKEPPPLPEQPLFIMEEWVPVQAEQVVAQKELLTLQ